MKYPAFPPLPTVVARTTSASSLVGRAIETNEGTPRTGKTWISRPTGKARGVTT